MPVGPDGVRGSQWRNGSGVPAFIPGTDLEGDYYLNSNGDVWRFNGTSWVNTGINIKGAPGTAGDDGGDGAGYFASSNTSLAIGTGSKTFTTQSGLAYSANARVRAAYDSSNYMEGTVTSYSGTTLILNIDRIVGGGTYASWTINIAGDVGAAGSNGSQGDTGAAGAGYYATSSSNVAMATGDLTFTTQSGLAYSANARVRVANSDTNYVEGTVSSYSGTTLVVSVDRVVGSGTYNSWTINLAGDTGSVQSYAYANQTFNTDVTLTAGVDAQVQNYAGDTTQTTTANRTITLVPSTDPSVSNHFVLIFNYGKVGTGFSITIKQGASTLETFYPASMQPRIYNCYWNGSAYKVISQGYVLPNTGSSSYDNRFVELRVMGTEWNYATLGGAVGTLNLTNIFPAGSHILRNLTVIHTQTALSEVAGTPTVSWGLSTGGVAALDAARNFNAAPYNTDDTVAAGSVTTPYLVTDAAGEYITMTIASNALDAGYVILFVPYFLFRNGL